MANTKLTRTFTAGNRRTYTISCWVKKGFASDFQTVNAAGAGDDGIFFNGDNTLHCWFNGGEKRTNRKFRDPNAWYHIVCAVDTTNSTAGDRIKIYINGERITSFQTDTNPSLNAENHYNNSGKTNAIGNHTSSSYYMNGSISHMHYADGTAYDASTFGSTDATTGEWKINTNPTFTPGTNGFTILKDGNTITDQSANSNNFTLASGTLTKTEDCPSNVFATMNPLLNTNSNLSFTNGNTKMATSSQWLGSCSTLPMFQGKFYWEFKGDPNFMIGVSQLNSDATEIVELSTANTGYSSRFATGYEIINGGNKSNNNNSSTSYGSSYSSSDIGMIAFDATNGVLWFGKNGAWQNSATQTQIENGTTTYAAYTGLTNSNGYVASCSVENGHMEFNFGNGYFGTTAISSEGTNASGIGKFEYDVPSGYTALSTKGLNE